MATFPVVPPEQFNSSRPESQPQWFQRFERFRVASGVAKEQPFQINTLIHTMVPKRRTS